MVDATASPELIDMSTSPLSPWLPWLLAELMAGVLLGVMAVLLWRQIQVRRLAERQAVQARSELLPLAQALRRTFEAVVVTDVARRITWVNEAFERVSGYRAGEVIGQSPGALLQFAGTRPETVAQMKAALDAGQGFVGEILNRGRHPEPYWLAIDIQPMHDPQGRLTGFVSIQTDVTERRRAEVALRASQALLDNAGRIAGVGGWTYDAASGRLRCTTQVAHLLGLSEARLPGLRDGLRRIQPDSRRALWRLVHRSTELGQTLSIDLALLTPAGERRWLRVTVEGRHADPLVSAAVVTGTLLDVSDRLAAKAKLQRSASLLRGALEAVDEAFALFDPQDRLVFCNDKYRDLYAESRDAIVPGATFAQIVRYGAERGQYPAAIGRVDEWVEQRLAVFKQGERTLVQQLCNGRIVRVIDRKTPDGHSVGFRVDITELVQATEAAEAADRAKTQFIATVSHELRTPLQVITGFSDLGRHFAQDHPQFKPMFDDIHAAGLRMLQLVNELLDISRFDGSVGELTLRRQRLAPLMQSVARELAQLAAQRQVRITHRVPPDLVAAVEAFRFQQVLRNVLANALRFAPEQDEIVIEAVDLGLGGVELTVRDHGPGIPEGELETVFEPFVQSSRTRDGAGGTGLGLAISRRIMGAHAGRISAEAPEGGGALIRLWLPPPLPDANAAPRGPKLLHSGLRPQDHAPAHASDEPTLR